MPQITVNLNDEQLSQFTYTIDDPKSDVAVTNDQFLLITHHEGASYFNVNHVQFFEILTEESAQ